jgi:transcription elongation factor Elf1
MIYVASCRRCNSQTIIPHVSQKEPPTLATVRFYCTNCGLTFTLDELMGLYIAL